MIYNFLQGKDFNNCEGCDSLSSSSIMTFVGFSVVKFSINPSTWKVPCLSPRNNRLKVCLRYLKMSKLSLCIYFASNVGLYGWAFHRLALFMNLIFECEILQEAREKLTRPGAPNIVRKLSKNWVARHVWSNTARLSLHGDLLGWVSSA